MRKLILLFILTVFYSFFGVAQHQNSWGEKSFTDPDKGFRVELQQGDHVSNSLNPVLLKAPLAPGINWEYTDAASIEYYVKVSSQSENTLAAWGTNDQRVSHYGSSSVPLWEVPFTIAAWDEVIDMTEDGMGIAVGVNDQVEVYAPGSAVPTWSTRVPYFVKGIQIRNDGQQVFVAAVDPNLEDHSFVYCYNVGQNTPVWVKSFPGHFTAFVLNKSGNRLLLAEYGGVNSTLFVMNAETSDLVFQTVYTEQYPPAISDDGKYIVSGDFSGHVFLYEYNEAIGTYAEKWSYSVNGTNSWVTGMGISGDGSIIAIGTMMFTSSGGFDGELYVFNNYSPEPLWIYPNMGDMVQCVDLSSDGSIIAAGSWGPMDNSVPDIVLFRKQSNIPYLTVNSPGSIFCLDLSSDGTLCATGGKAVHAREMGYGGKLYNINSDPGGGILSGLAVKSASVQQAGARVEILELDNYFCYSDNSSEYILKYIPEGTYMAEYSAVGYISQVIEVEIISGQVTNQNVTLLPTDEPPSNLTATHGAAYNVQLNWQPSPANGIVAYNVYRKQFAFDFYPVTPIGTVGSNETSYTDNSALPLIHYYYAVTGQLDGDLQTPYSNDAEGWIATGFITNDIDAWTGLTPIIDGVISPDEWNDGFKVDISNMLGRNDNLIKPIGSVMAWFKVNSDNTSLYVAVEDFNDTVLEDHDEIALYVDDNNDGSYPITGDSTEGNYWAVHYASGDVIKYRPIFNTGGVGNVFYLPNPQIAVSDASGHLVYEFVIPLGTEADWQIDFDTQNQSGIFVFGLDDPSNFDGWWPCLNQNIFNPGGYGVITFGGFDAIPPPPENLVIDNTVPQDVILSWDQPQISDFNHFNVYSSFDGGPFAIIDNTVGIQYFRTLTTNGTYLFYVTTVDHAGQESVPSNTVQTFVNTGVAETGQSNDILMIKMGPNPFSQQMNIEFELVKETQLVIRVFDINGKLVNTLHDSKTAIGQHRIPWDGYNQAGIDLQPGLYVVQFCPDHGNTVSFKIMKK